jgi:hypothetical protein
MLCIVPVERFLTSLFLWMDIKKANNGVEPVE